MKLARFLISLAMTSTLACSGSSEETASTNATATATASSGETDGGSESDTAGGVDRAICDRYIECVAVTTPEALPAIKDGFGSDAVCWMQGQSDIDICLSACEAGIASTHEIYPDAVECYLCTADSECDEDAGETCWMGECGTGMCGDGIVQADEICDGADECTNDCLGGANCSPLTGVGCGTGQKCYLFEGQDFIGASCSDSDNVCGDDLCDGGFFCGTKEGMGTDAECLPYCDMNAPMPCPDGLECMEFTVGFDDLMFDESDALSYLGRCR